MSTPQGFLTALLLLLSCQLCASAPHRLRDVSTLTTFKIDGSCNATQEAIIVEANKDALTLANAPLQGGHHDLGENPDGKWIDFSTYAANDFWGPQSRNSPYQQRIFDTLYRATQAYAGLGFWDWWYDRYVDVYCVDKIKKCKGKTPAYIVSNPKNSTYPYIVYCGSFFDILDSHAERVSAILSDHTGAAKLNLRNLRSRASTVLHKWLHIHGFPSEICEGGCKDTEQVIGGETIDTYKAGRAKLLAWTDPELAAQTNDNFVYFAMAHWMEKAFGIYPNYPLAWKPTLTPDQNRAIEDLQPGANTSVQSWEMSDSDAGTDDEVTPTATSAPLAVSLYPQWYQPVLEAAGSTTVPPISTPTATEQYGAAPSIDSVICQPSSGSPKIEDCIHAFGVLNSSPNATALHAKNGETWWASVSMQYQGSSADG
jgi:hypothetical protein